MISRCESRLNDTNPRLSQERTFPLWEKKIKYELKRGRNVLVVAHANTLRGLVKTIDNIGDDEIQGKLRCVALRYAVYPPYYADPKDSPIGGLAEVAIPTGIPIVYKFDKDMMPIPPVKEDLAVSQIHMNGLFLEKPGLLKEALKREEAWARAVPGYDMTMARRKSPLGSLERSLYKLNAVRELGEWAKEFIDPAAEVEDDGNDGNMGKPIQILEDEIWEIGMAELEQGGQFDPDAPVFHETVPNGSFNGAFNDTQPVDVEMIARPNFYTQPCVASMPSASVFQIASGPRIRRDSVIVIIRHGKTEHNKLGLFTGWEDAPLADEGVKEAKEAGRLLKQHGFEFDVVYTSWLSRAIETAWYVMDEMDALWLPIIKTWRLNERMYGELTGMSKQMVKQRHGEKQFKAWRRGYDVKPPAVSSFSPDYPGNDPRYQRYLKDVPYSIKESIIRSIEKGEPTLHRRFPKTESLKDCMERTIPYLKERIFPDAIDQGKRVLISSSENAIRGLLMHLCDIPVDEITGLEIPNGLPLIFDVKSKCVKVSNALTVNGCFAVDFTQVFFSQLLDDGTGRDPLEVYNFGKAAKYLFRPCKNEDGTPDEVSDHEGGKRALQTLFHELAKPTFFHQECSIHFESDKTTFLTKEEQDTIALITKKQGPQVPVETSV